MAIQPSNITQAGTTATIQRVQWNLLANGDSGVPYQFPDWSDRTVQITGTFGAGGTVVIEGSNDGTNWTTLTDLNGSAMSFTAAALKAISESPLYMRPRVTAGDGTTSILVVLSARRLLPIA